MTSLVGISFTRCTKESKNITRNIIKVTTKVVSAQTHNEIAKQNYENLTKVHQLSTSVRTKSGSAIRTILLTSDHPYTSMTSEPLVLSEIYDKQDKQPYSLIKSRNAIQWNTG